MRKKKNKVASHLILGLKKTEDAKKRNKNFFNYVRIFIALHLLIKQGLFTKVPGGIYKLVSKKADPVQILDEEIRHRPVIWLF